MIRIPFQGGGMDMGSKASQAKSKGIGEKGDFGGLGGGQKFGSDPGKYNVNREVVERAQAAPIAAAKYGIPDVKQDEGILGLFKDVAFNPFASFVTGSLPGMFASLAFGKGPYTKESLVTGNFADLTNAPADYRQAVLDTMGGTYSEVQKEQIKAGDEAKKAEQEATRGPENPLGDISPTTPMNPFEGDAIKTQRYQDFMVAGYPPDMAEYLVGVLM
jgi:hypothetical protein